MRLWSLHPSYLDAKGLVALWRETLLAQKVLLDKTKAYKNHPQLERFKNHRNPVGAVASYLVTIIEEADKRDYKFDKSKICNNRIRGQITVTDEQLQFEFKHLKFKLKSRDPENYSLIKKTIMPNPNPLFRVIKGNIADWERM